MHRPSASRRPPRGLHRRTHRRVCQVPTSSAQAGCAAEPGSADAGDVPPACAVAAPGARPASRLARKLLNGKFRDSPLRLFRPDVTLACASPDRLSNTPAGAPSGKRIRGGALVRRACRVGKAHRTRARRGRRGGFYRHALAVQAQGDSLRVIAQVRIQIRERGRCGIERAVDPVRSQDRVAALARQIAVRADMQHRTTQIGRAADCDAVALVGLRVRLDPVYGTGFQCQVARHAQRADGVPRRDDATRLHGGAADGAPCPAH
ncbi:hypothetical protein G6F65_017880 [Rhizopus arrhizus]|nr:hypothetical protein G6F65_017880 [Rhizopus arrhizus]